MRKTRRNWGGGVEEYGRRLRARSGQLTGMKAKWVPPPHAHTHTSGSKRAHLRRIPQGESLDCRFQSLCATSGDYAAGDGSMVRPEVGGGVAGGGQSERRRQGKEQGKGKHGNLGQLSWKWINSQCEHRFLSFLRIHLSSEVSPA